MMGLSLNHSGLLYFLISLVMICTFSFLLTRSNEGIVRMAFVINIVMSCFLMLVGEMAIFLSLIFLNFFVFFIANIAALKESEKRSFQEPAIDIPAIIIMLIVIGVTVITLVQNIDFLNISELKITMLESIDVADFREYIDLVSLIFIVFISVILFFNTKSVER